VMEVDCVEGLWNESWAIDHLVVTVESALSNEAESP